MKKDIKVILKIKDEEKTRENLAKALADITKMRIEELPEHLREKAYKIIINK